MNIPGLGIPDTYIFYVPVFDARNGRRARMVVEAYTAEDAAVSVDLYFRQLGPNWFIDPNELWSFAGSRSIEDGLFILNEAEAIDLGDEEVEPF